MYYLPTLFCLPTQLTMVTVELHDEHPTVASIRCRDVDAGVGTLELCTLQPEDVLEDERRAPGQCSCTRAAAVSAPAAPSASHVGFEFSRGGLHHLTRLLLQCPSCVVEGAPESWMQGVERVSRRDSLARSRANAWRSFVRSRDYGELGERIFGMMWLPICFWAVFCYLCAFAIFFSFWDHSPCAKHGRSGGRRAVAGRRWIIW